VGHSGHSIIIALMMGTEMVPETLDFNELTRLSAREEFINWVICPLCGCYLSIWQFLLNLNESLGMLCL
jgi:hypothetical protein